MNDEGARQGAPDASSYLPPNLAPRRDNDSAASPLQVWLGAAYDLLADARAELDETSYSTFIGLFTNRIGKEAARLAIGEAIQITRRSAA
jgi:hypothetical protein